MIEEYSEPKDVSSDLPLSTSKAMSLKQRLKNSFKPFFNPLVKRFSTINYRLGIGDNRLDVLENRLSLSEAVMRKYDQVVAKNREAANKDFEHFTAIVRGLRARLDQLESVQNAILERLDAILERLDVSDARELERINSMAATVASLGGQLSSLSALGWDAVAISRRLAILEDRTELLLQESEAIQNSDSPPLVAYPIESKEAG